MSGFGIEADRLKAINSDKDSAKWRELGGIDKVAAALQTDLKSGLNSADVDRNREAFGANRFKEVPTKTFLSILLEALKDPTLILLMFAATISTVLGAAIKEERDNNAWVEGVAIWVAVILVSMVGSVNDYQKELQFKKLNAEKDAIMVKVIRDGKEQLVPNTDIVVGDVMVLDTGDKVIADGVEIEGHNLVIDEASLTGESDPIKKQPDGDFWCRSGSQVGARTCLA
jgi:P-type Ca2+ transporter type 2C